MKQLKIMAIIGMVICGLGLLGSFFLMSSDSAVGFGGLIVYAYFLWLSIVAYLQATKENKI